MRLAVLTNVPTPYRMPVFERLAHEDGVEVRFFFDAASDATTPASAENLPSERLSPAFAVARRFYQDEARYAERLPMRFSMRYLPRLAAFRPDVIISGEFGWRTLNAAAWSLLAGVPLLIWWEGTPFTERRAGALRLGIRRLLAHRASALLGFGRGSVAYLEAFAPAGTPVRFVPQAVDNAGIARETDRWRSRRDAIRAELGLRGTVLLCVSRLLPHKGIPELLSAVQRLRKTAARGSFTLLVAGDGPLRGAVERAAQDTGDVRALGAVPPDQVPRWLACADLLVFPTLRDCWGMVVNEALAAGLPVLGSCRAGACEELLEREEVGLRFDPVDPASFDAALHAAVVEQRFSATPAAMLRSAVRAHTCEAAAATLLASARQCLPPARAAEVQP